MSERHISDILTEIMLAIALRQPDPKERAAMLEILRKDGGIAESEVAA